MPTEENRREPKHPIPEHMLEDLIKQEEKILIEMDNLAQSQKGNLS